MDFKRSITILCIFSMILLFAQCEKEDIIVKKEYQPAADAIQDANAKKPDKPPGQDQTVETKAAITGNLAGTLDEFGDIGCYVNEETIIKLTINDQFNHDGISEEGAFDGTIRIMYSTKKRGENRIDFWYEDDGDPKYIMIRQANPNDAYDPETRTMTLSDAYALLAYRDGTGETYWEFTASATVVLKDCD